jgi:hypothetical protein
MLNGLSDNQTVKLLVSGSPWGKRAIREIVRRKDDFIPRLLDILDYVCRHLHKIGYDYTLHIPAAFLLAQFREPRAYPKLIHLLNLDEDQEELIWGDIVCDNFFQILRDTYNGDSGLLRSVLENRSCSPWIRTTVIDAYAMLAYDSRITREDLVKYFRYLIGEIYPPSPSKDDKVVLTFLVNAVEEHGLTEMAEDIKVLFDRDAVDPNMYQDYEDFIQTLNKNEKKIRDIHMDDTIRELDEIAWFKKEDSADDDNDEDSDDYDDYDGDDFTDPAGRNDPCPCGSGKKYKRCCMYKK